MGALAMGAVAAGREAVAAAITAAQSHPHYAQADPLYAVIYDERFPQCAAFAARARSRGQRAEGLERGDVTRLWYDDLYHRWKQGPAAIAGLTAPGALFVLETFGNDAGLRLQFRAEHRQQGDRVEHRLCGPDVMLRNALTLQSSGSHWGAHMAQVVGGARPAHFGREEVRLMTHLRGAPQVEQNILVSWVLAPRPCRSRPT
jgi:hypothetical protein